jgi:hypothetical protein
MTLISRSDLFACSVHNTPKHLLARCNTENNGVLARLDTDQNDMPARFDKSKAAALLSSLGASKGGKARAEALTPEERNEIAQKAANIRWQTKRKVKE